MRTSRIASVPPVDAPIAMMRSVVRSILPPPEAGMIASAENFGATRAAATGALRACARAGSHADLVEDLAAKVGQCSREIDLRLRDEVDGAELERFQCRVGTLLRQ